MSTATSRNRLTVKYRPLRPPNRNRCRSGNCVDRTCAWCRRQKRMMYRPPVRRLRPPPLPPPPRPVIFLPPIKLPVSRRQPLTQIVIECSICYNEIASTFLTQQLPCGHKFHKTCIHKWFVQAHYPKTCPLCRRVVY